MYIIRRTLTCVSNVEQHGAGREAEVGDVGSELKPLHRRGGNKRQMLFLSSARALNKRLFMKLFTVSQYTVTITITQHRKCHENKASHCFVFILTLEWHIQHKEAFGNKVLVFGQR